MQKDTLNSYIQRVMNDRDAKRIYQIIEKGPTYDGTVNDFKRFGSMGVTNRLNKTPEIRNERS